MESSLYRLAQKLKLLFLYVQISLDLSFTIIITSYKFAIAPINTIVAIIPQVKDTLSPRKIKIAGS